jgi:PAS domain S-box-containing protein
MPPLRIHSVQHVTVALFPHFPLEVAPHVLLHRLVPGADWCVALPKLKPLSGQTCPEAFQSALDALDVIGRWEWDASTDGIRSDAFVALLFGLDPKQAEKGATLAAYIDGIHADDRERVLALIRRSAQEGSTFLTEYRVISVDGRTRWVLARGRFTTDHSGRPLCGSGILVDITQMRMFEGTFDKAGTYAGEAPLDRAADHAIAAQEAIAEMQDPKLKALADALLLGLGRKLAQQEVHERRRHMN